MCSFHPTGLATDDGPANPILNLYPMNSPLIELTGEVDGLRIVDIIGVKGYAADFEDCASDWLSPLEITRQASESRVWLLQAGWDVSAGVEESPDVNGAFVRQVEQQVRELADCHDSEIRHREFVRETKRSEARVPADALHCGFDCVDEADGCCDVGFSDVVAAG